MINSQEPIAVERSPLVHTGKTGGARARPARTPHGPRRRAASRFVCAPSGFLGCSLLNCSLPLSSTSAWRQRSPRRTTTSASTSIRRRTSSSTSSRRFEPALSTTLSSPAPRSAGKGPTSTPSRSLPPTTLATRPSPRRTSLARSSPSSSRTTRPPAAAHHGRCVSSRVFRPAPTDGRKSGAARRSTVSGSQSGESSSSSTTKRSSPSPTPTCGRMSSKMSSFGGRRATPRRASRGRTGASDLSPSLSARLVS